MCYVQHPLSPNVLYTVLFRFFKIHIWNSAMQRLTPLRFLLTSQTFNRINRRRLKRSQPKYDYGG